MAIAIVLVLVVVGSFLFHFLSPWWFTPLASNWGAIDDTIMITFVVTGFVFAAVVLFAAYAIYKFRHKEGSRAHYEPENKKLELWLTIFTAVGVVVMLAPGLVVWGQFVTVPEDASEFEAVGEQWRWSFRFPGADGKLGTVDATNITFDNPFGMNSGDPNGRDDILVEDFELHLPMGSPIKVLLRSKDVLHDFYVPQFRAKMDLVPGLVSYFWFTPTREGTFDLLCAELCGTGHYTMKGKVTVEKEEAFQAWLANYPTYAESIGSDGGGAAAAADDPVAAGRKLAEDQGCLACHSVDGSKGVGPSWKGLFGKTETLDDGSSVVVDAAYLAESITDPNAKIVSGFGPMMPPYELSDAELEALRAYIESGL